MLTSSPFHEMLAGFDAKGDPINAEDVKQDGQQYERRRKLIAELKACSHTRNLTWGRKVHEAAGRTSDNKNVYVASMLIKMYASCGSMGDARRAFELLDHPDVACWNALILGYADNGKGESALALFSRLGRESCAPDEISFLAALKACSDLAVREKQMLAAGNRESRDKGKRLHLLALRNGCYLHINVQGTLVDMYAKCGSMPDARRVFDSMKCPSVVAWTALILGYAENGQSDFALKVFSQMRSAHCAEDEVTLVALLKACIVQEDLTRGKQLHLLALANGWDSDVFVQATLVDMYAKCGSMRDAVAAFHSIKRPDLVCWNALILGYAESGEGKVALDFLLRMKLKGCAPDQVTFVAALMACTDIAVRSEDKNKRAPRERGKKLHLLALKCGCNLDTYLQGTLVDLYAKCGSMSDSRQVFDRIDNPNVVCWTALILGYADNGQSETALKMFSRMGREGCAADAITFVAALKACSDLAGVGGAIATSRERGRVLHLLATSFGFDSDGFVGNTLLDMYANVGSMGDAQTVFHRMKHPNTVSWTALISGYAENGEGEMSLDLFSSMVRQSCCAPSTRTFAAVLKACGKLGALEIGKALHAEVCRQGLENDPVLTSCLVDFYAKCGSLTEAERAFHSSSSRDLVTWNSLLTGYSFHGDTKGAFDLFDRMRESCVKPDRITFSVILAVCSHAGLVEKGRWYFEAMSTSYGVDPELEHYTCLIDMLGRANKLHDAMVLIERMPFRPSAVTWMTVLAACVRWKYVELGKLAFEYLMSLKDRNARAYVLMANIYGTHKAKT